MHPRCGTPYIIPRSARLLSEVVTATILVEIAEIIPVGVGRARMARRTLHPRRRTPYLISCASRLLGKVVTAAILVGIVKIILVVIGMIMENSLS